MKDANDSMENILPGLEEQANTRKLSRLKAERHAALRRKRVFLPIEDDEHKNLMKAPFPTS